MVWKHEYQGVPSDTLAALWSPGPRALVQAGSLQLQQSSFLFQQFAEPGLCHGRDQTETMRFTVGVLSLLTIPAGSLRLPGSPAAAATRSAVWATSAVRAAERTAVLRREALLIGKVHGVARGGGDRGDGGDSEEGEGGRSEGILARAASLPLLQVLPPQVKIDGS